MFALCDFVNVMTYDLHGGWEHKTGLHSALYHGSHDNTIINVHNSIQFLRNNGVDKKKIVVGIPTYGCRFKLQDPNNHEIGAPASSHPVRKSSYRDIWPRVQCRDLTHQFDHEQKSSYAFHGNEWISFDCHNSVTEKANYIHHNGLGGAMFW
jgi:chitinase